MLNHLRITAMLLCLRQKAIIHIQQFVPVVRAHFTHSSTCKKAVIQGVYMGPGMLYPAPRHYVNNFWLSVCHYLRHKRQVLHLFSQKNLTF